MTPHTHSIIRCKYCDAVIAQCRCMGPKATTYETCAHCAKLIAAGQPLFPATDQFKALLCGVISMSGPHHEPLACAYPPGHAGDHSWATLPTFVGGAPVSGKAVLATINVANMAEVVELVQGAIEATDATPRTARLRAALQAFGVE